MIIGVNIEKVTDTVIFSIIHNDSIIQTVYWQPPSKGDWLENLINATLKVVYKRFDIIPDKIVITKESKKYFPVTTKLDEYNNAIKNFKNIELDNL